MTYNNITGMYTCPFCGAISPVDYGVSCGCLYDDMPRDTPDRDPIRDMDWYLIDGMFVGYSDDATIVASIKDAYKISNNGSDYFTFVNNGNTYRLYF